MRAAFYGSEWLCLTCCYELLPYLSRAGFPGFIAFMRLIRLTSLSVFATGLLIAVFAIACSGGDKKEEATPAPDTATTAPSNTALPTDTATPSPTSIPTATPTPYNGAVARMKIPSLGVDFPIEKLGLIAGQNQLDTPHNELGAIGWYEIPEYPRLAKPGFNGNSFFSAHVNYFSNGSYPPGPFANLYKIQGGDMITVQMDGGPEYTYQVFATQGFSTAPQYVTASRPLIDMGKLIDTPDKPANEEWITLMTCSCAPGRFANGECFDRDVVLAKRVK